MAPLLNGRDKIGLECRAAWILHVWQFPKALFSLQWQKRTMKSSELNLHWQGWLNFVF
jgi:hypothetical protein